MKVERFEEKHYPMVKTWWEKHGHPVLPFSMLSPIGLVSSNDEGPLCVSFLYVVGGCDMAQIGWTTTNPDAPMRQRYKGVDYCIKALIGLAKHYNKTNVICLTGSNGLKKIICSNGLKELYDHKLLYGSLGAL